MLHLFHESDDGASGGMTPVEFLTALVELGFDGSADEADSLFATLDLGLRAPQTL